MTSRLTVHIPSDIPAPKNTEGNNMDLKDMLGPELDEYYDGWGVETKGKDYFFYHVPQNIINLVENRAKNYDILQLNISPN